MPESSRHPELGRNPCVEVPGNASCGVQQIVAAHFVFLIAIQLDPDETKQNSVAFCHEARGSVSKAPLDDFSRTGKAGSDLLRAQSPIQLDFPGPLQRRLRALRHGLGHEIILEKAASATSCPLQRTADCIEGSICPAVRSHRLSYGRVD